MIRAKHQEGASVAQSMNPSSQFTLPRTGQVLSNRSVLAAMTNKQSHLDGTLSDEEIKWLVRRAKGGFGITTTAAANVTEHGRGWDGNGCMGRPSTAWLDQNGDATQ